MTTTKISPTRSSWLVNFIRTIFFFQISGATKITWLLGDEIIEHEPDEGVHISHNGKPLITKL